MAYTRFGDVDRLHDYGFKPCPSRSLFQEWVMGKGDYMFMISLTESAWKLTIARFGLDGVGHPKLVNEAPYHSCDELLLACDEFIDEYNVEDKDDE